MESKLYRYLVFLVPLLFSIQTRFLRRSRLGIIVWATEYLIPVLIAMIVLNVHCINLVHGLISIVAVYNLYEIGYIQNDCETIKHEEHPTLRLSSESLHLYEKYKIHIYVTRIVIGVCFSWYMIRVGNNLWAVIAMWAIIPLYLIYNKLRGRINLYLIVILTTYRYCFPIYLYAAYKFEYIWIIIICMFLAYPFPTFIEICTDGKGNPPEKWTKLFMKDFESRFIFRVRYYSIMSILCVTLAYLELLPYICVLIPLYYLADRIPQLRMKKLGVK